MPIVLSNANILQKVTIRKLCKLISKVCPRTQLGIFVEELTKYSGVNILTLQAIYSGYDHQWNFPFRF